MTGAEGAPSGVRALDFGRCIAGPFRAALPAGFGAGVIAAIPAALPGGFR